MKIKLIIPAVILLMSSCAKDDGSTSSNHTYGCPTTSKCGCSSKTKSECQSSSCCAWYTGNGCGCK